MAIITRWRHAAGELVRVLCQAAARLGDPDLSEELLGAGERRAGRELAVVELQGLAELAADGDDRIERGEGVLEDKTDVAAEHPPPLDPAASRGDRDRGTAPRRDDPSRARQQPESPSARRTCPTRSRRRRRGFRCGRPRRRRRPRPGRSGRRPRTRRRGRRFRGRGRCRRVQKLAFFRRARSGGRAPGRRGRTCGPTASGHHRCRSPSSRRSAHRGSGRRAPPPSRA